MRRLYALGALLFLLVPLAQPQDTPQWELYGGYSFARLDVSPDLAPIGLDKINQHGWHASVSENVNQWLGGEAEFTGTYAQPQFSDPLLGTIRLKTSAYSFLFGPRFSRRKWERVTPFAHVLFGGVHVQVSTPLLPGLTGSDTAFAVKAGGGLDVRVNNRIAIRVVQADYVRTHFSDFDDDRQNNLNFSTGVVFRFGRR